MKCKTVADRSFKKVTHIQDQFNAVLHEGLVSQLANKERHNEEFFWNFDAKTRVHHIIKKTPDKSYIIAKMYKHQFSIILYIKAEIHQVLLSHFSLPIESFRGK